ncbi:hypothetical protein AB0M29_44495 [Streptomyces sp. NPDC051976]|uniref:hypothetical protein n=1 Tax=Streptomyces sp. NPDC051976 TaxID=3154947 RepID=UPI003419F733
MNADNSPSPRTTHTLGHLQAEQGVLTLRQLRERGVTPGTLAERCRPGGPWRQLLPQVYLLHSGPPTSAERVQAALLYAGRDPWAHGPVGGGREAMVTGLAALALRRFSSVPPLPGLPVIDVLVPRQRRLRDTGGVAIHRVRELPRAQEVVGLPCAPVPRALADAVAELDDAVTVRRLLIEAVRGGHCTAAAVVAGLGAAGLLERPDVTAAVDALLADSRALAEELLYTMVRRHALPDPVWNVDLRLPGGPQLGGVDAYWPEHAVAVEIDARTARPRHRPGEEEDGVHDVCADGAFGDGPAPGAYEHADDDAVWSRYARQRERLEALGVTVIHLTPAKLQESAEQQAAIVRTALLASADRTPAAYVVVTPR